jgi:GT2 family glycosyltransferase
MLEVRGKMFFETSTSKSYKTMSQETACVVLVNFNGGKDTIECIGSLMEVSDALFSLVIVDNGSTDNSFDMISQYLSRNGRILRDTVTAADNGQGNGISFPASRDNVHITEYRVEYDNQSSKVTLVKSDKNLGFAGGCNLGINCAFSDEELDYFLLLNNDTIVDSNFLTEMMKVCLDNDNSCLVGASIFSYWNRNEVWFEAGKVRWSSPTIGNHMRLKTKTEVAETGFITGCCMMIPRKVIMKVGLLDQEYFLYFEDADYCLRAHKMGMKLLIATKAKIYHKISSASTKAPVRPTAIYWSHMSRLLFIKKNCPTYLKPIVSSFCILRSLTTMVYYLVIKENECCRIVRRAIVDTMTDALATES